jgi:hypothetical protein
MGKMEEVQGRGWEEGERGARERIEGGEGESSGDGCSELITYLSAFQISHFSFLFLPLPCIIKFLETESFGSVVNLSKNTEKIYVRNALLNIV